MAGENRMPVTVIGLGAMGQALAGAFLDAGHPTTVWNRSAHKADALVARGAVRAGTPAEAVRAGGLVVVCVVDYAASQAILGPLAAELAGRVLVNLTSDTPERAREAAAWAAEHGIDYLDGAIMVPVPVIGSPQALLFYSGPREVFEAQEATLRALGGNSRYLGADHGVAPLYDLALLGLFYSSMAAMLHSLALVGADKVTAKEFLPYIKEFLALLPAIADQVADGIDNRDYPGDLGNLAMEAAGVDHILEASETRGLDSEPLAAVRALMGRAIAQGHGGDGFASVIEVLERPSV
ncbi:MULTISPECIES: NAD(P)-dependent oxidoreductase [Streptomyces]|uniref:NAD(P)-binding domain-containing protein n=1 Tax=Streptomyces lonegramiae TaxID=3075524 RepID=A0ABU2XVU7_9ACTN|nr:NAD(P)-binding domain-containing protein [Streptomyces sp. DSM 41529]MDT0549660.1 NAD(P)-binding domain-containing protein [Streptomyces sp. DSM 41529]